MSHTSIPSRLHHDRRFQALSVEGAWLYLYLCTSGHRDNHGVVDITDQSLLERSKLQPDQFTTALTELVGAVPAPLVACGPRPETIYLPPISIEEKDALNGNLDAERLENDRSLLPAGTSFALKTYSGLRIESTERVTPEPGGNLSSPGSCSSASDFLLPKRRKKSLQRSACFREPMENSSKTAAKSDLASESTNGQVDMFGAPAAPSVNCQPDCPHGRILALWSEIMPELPQPNPELWSGQRRANLARRWREGFNRKKRDGSGTWYVDAESALTWWGNFFRYLRRSDFLMTRCTGFQRQGLGWCLRSETFTKIMEKAYHE